MCIQRICATLKNSPLYHASLSSLELFHSNFLGWLFTRYPELILTVFEHHIVNAPYPFGWRVEARRENRNIDLRLNIFHRGQLLETLMIENKVKSLPDQAQLQRYANDPNINAPGNRLILLSLIDPDFPLPQPWRHMSYRDLAKGLESACSKKVMDVYHQSLVADYLVLLEQLNRLVWTCTLDCVDPDVPFFLDPADMAELKECRLYSFVHKLRYLQLSQCVEQALQAQGLPVGLPVHRGHWLGANVGQVYIETGYSNGNGSITVGCRLRAGPNFLVVGIQLQGTSFRLFLERQHDHQALLCANAIANNGLWFDFGHITQACGPLPVLPNNGFNTYHNINPVQSYFKYRHVNLGNCNNAVAVPTLVSIFVDYIIDLCAAAPNILQLPDCQ